MTMTMTMKAYWINEHECWSGETLDHAIQACVAASGLSREEVVGDYVPHEAKYTSTVCCEDFDEGEKDIGQIVAEMTEADLVCCQGLD